MTPEKPKEIVAKVKFWFGIEQQIFDLRQYTVEYMDQYAFIYKKNEVE